MIQTYQLSRRQYIPRALSEVSTFFERPENLARLTPPTLGFHIMTPSPIEMKSGAIIDYSIKVMGLNIHWRTMITTYEPPRKFIDEQLKGPYLFWHHTHRFQETDDGTIMTDTVRYAMPFGVLGRIAHALVVRHQLRQIFDYRAVCIVKEFSGSGSRYSVAESETDQPSTSHHDEEQA